MAASNASLRTKTGCLTCRGRRKKCDEQRPRCEKCTKSNRECCWPGEDDLFDRRHSRVSKSPRLEPKSPKNQYPRRTSSVAARLTAEVEIQPFFVCQEISFESDIFNSTLFQSDLEIDCMRHFFDGFLPLLILSNAHPGFFSAYIPETVNLLLQFEGLQDVALACGASHMHQVTGSLKMKEAGLSYYSRAVSKVSQALNNIDWSSDDHDLAVLISVTFLYLHGVFTKDTHGDISKHVTGAVQLINLRCEQSHKPPIARPIHRIIWESILYQTFRQTARRPFSFGFEPDIEFCARAQGVLQSLTFPDSSPAENSPVIGIPLDLQKLIIEIVQRCRSPYPPSTEVTVRLMHQMQSWESALLEDEHCTGGKLDGSECNTPAGRSRVFHRHSTSLYILAASQLLDWLLKSFPPGVSSFTKTKLPAPCDSWQVRKALQIMRCPQISDEWARCYLGSWPALIFGYAVDQPEDVALIRSDFRRRFHNLYSSEEMILLDELESVWRQRGIEA